MSPVAVLIGLLSFRGFRPRPAERLHPLRDRLRPGTRLAYLSVSESAILTASILLRRTRHQVTQVESARLDPGQTPLDHPLIAGLSAKASGRLVLVHHGDIDRIEILQSLRRTSAYAETLLLATDPRTVLGTDAGDLRHGHLTHPVGAYGVVAGVELRTVEAVEAALRERGLTVVRSQASMLAALSAALAVPAIARGRAGLVVADHGHLLLFPVDDAGQWGRPRLLLQALLRDPALGSTLRNLIPDSGSRPYHLVDTGTNPAFDASGASFTPLPLDGIEGVHIAPLAGCADGGSGHRDDPPTILRGLAHELGPVGMGRSELLPGWLRPVAIGFYAALTILLGASLAWDRRAAALEAEAEEVYARIGPVRAERDRIRGDAEELERSLAESAALADWVSSNRMLQPVLLGLLQRVAPDVRLHQFALTREDGPARSARPGVYVLDLSFEAEPRMVSVTLAALTAGAAGAGWSLQGVQQTSTNGVISYQAMLRPLDPAVR